MKKKHRFSESAGIVFDQAEQVEAELAYIEYHRVQEKSLWSWVRQLVCKIGLFFILR